MKCRILYVIDNTEFGGGERLFAQLISRLPRDRYRITVACAPGGIFEEKIKGSGALLEPIDMRNRFNPGIILRLVNIVKREKIDIVHSQGGRADFFARIVARLAKVPVLISTIQMPVEGYDVNPVKKSVYVALDRLSERFVDKFIVVSKSLGQALIQKHKITPDKLVLIYNGIEVDEYRPNGKEVRREFGLEDGVPVIGAIGRLVWQKGFNYFIEAIPEIVRHMPDAKFLLVGDGPLRERLEALSEELKVRDNVIFTGFRSDIKEILSTVDLLVVPSLLEGFPMVTLEAMAMAKPIVATNIDGITEQITDGVNGILIPPKDPSALAKTVVRVLNDKEFARSIGLLARKKVEQEFSVEKMVAETEEVYMSLLKAG